MIIATRLLSLLLVTFVLCSSSVAHSRRTENDSSPSSGISSQAQIRERFNAWTAGLTGGLLETAPIHFATEIARVVSDGGVVQVHQRSIGGYDRSFGRRTMDGTAGEGLELRAALISSLIVTKRSTANGGPSAMNKELEAHRSVMDRPG